MAMNVKEFLAGPVVDAASVNVGGYISKPFDDNVLYKVLPQLNPNASGSLGANAKYAKSALYTGAGLLLQFLVGDKGGSVGKIADAGSMVLYGMSACEGRDPVMYPKTYKTAASSGTANAPTYRVPLGQIVS